MEDVRKTRFEAKVDEREVALANEENEWQKRLGELAVKKPKKQLPPRKFRRVSARQRTAIGRNN